MAEKRIELTEIDPVDILGVNNKILDRLAFYYPKLTVVSRGNIITLKGEHKDMSSFEKKINELINKRE